MFRKLFPTGLATLALAAGLAGAAPATANAHHISGGIGYSSGHGRVELHIGQRGYKRHYRGHRQVCRPGRAIYKAERRGLRHARIARVNHRWIVVDGRRHGSRIKIAFHRDSPRCHVAWVKRSQRHGYRY